MKYFIMLLLISCGYNEISVKTNECYRDGSKVVKVVALENPYKELLVVYNGFDRKGYQLDYNKVFKEEISAFLFNYKSKVSCAEFDVEVLKYKIDWVELTLENIQKERK